MDGMKETVLFYDLVYQTPNVVIFLCPVNIKDDLHVRKSNSPNALSA
jgi:hypothetical protein